MGKWVLELQNGKMRHDDPFDVTKLERFDGSSRHNDPACEWDPECVGFYFIISSKSENGDEVALGSLLESTDKPFQPIAKKSDILHTSDQIRKFDPSQIITNSYEPWQSLVSRSFKEEKFEHIIREEWSKHRAVKYLKAALQVEALQKYITKEDSCLYVVTGIILGATAAEFSKVVGYKVLSVSTMQAEEGDRFRETSNLKLVIREKRARSSSEAKEFLPGKARELPTQEDRHLTQKSIEREPQDTSAGRLWYRTKYASLKTRTTRMFSRSASQGKIEAQR